MLITGTFLDEISHDIPHQNWGEKEWDRDFACMRATGIDTVILIRCGHKRFITYPSKVLMGQEKCFEPSMDLVDLFLRLSDRYGMTFYFGLYDSGNYWHNHQFTKELDLSKAVAEEVWKTYGHHPSFKGWYLNCEISRASVGMAHLYRDLGKFVKDLSGNLPTLISPYIAGIKANPDNATTIAEHERDWNAILSEIQGAVDIVAFQDGHCLYDELPDYLEINLALARKYGMKSWTNCESFDRDMPIRFLPIKWDKMRLKLEAAGKCGVDKAITFEFSHFMSPNSMYSSAHGLYDRYMEYRQSLMAREK
ncbi:MAG: DUF4434 domain-containing protein [Victivallales bacterium]|nr:DUF4434 domain-containing protein [Victivallales bacterium]